MYAGTLLHISEQTAPLDVQICISLLISEDFFVSLLRDCVIKKKISSFDGTRPLTLFVGPGKISVYLTLIYIKIRKKKILLNKLKVHNIVKRITNI